MKRLPKLYPILVVNRVINLPVFELDDGRKGAFDQRFDNWYEVEYESRCIDLPVEASN